MNIVDIHEEYNQIICPHTATAFDGLWYYDVKNYIVVSTAHPAKFKEIVEPIIHKEVSIPSNLREYINKPKTYIDLKAELNELVGLLDKSS